MSVNAFEFTDIDIGDGTVKPDANSTLSEASAILSRMLGYEAKMIEIGGYPDGCISVMRELGITDNLGNVNADEALIRDIHTEIF